MSLEPRPAPDRGRSKRSASSPTSISASWRGDCASPGLDTAYHHKADDATLAELADRQGRILLTRDVGLLMRRSVTHGYFVREIHPQHQLVEVLRRFGPLDLRPFSRCPRCNDLLREVPKSAVAAALLPRTREHYHHFELCDGCSRVYWKGSHWKRLKHAIDAARAEAEGDAI